MAGREAIRTHPDDAAARGIAAGNAVRTADRPSSRLYQGCAGQHALGEVERWPGEPPPVTVRTPPPLRPAP